MNAALTFLDSLDGPVVVGWSLLITVVLVAVFATAAARDHTPRRPSTPPTPTLTDAEMRDRMAEQGRAERYHGSGAWGR